jgi:hypothetical protein
MKRGQQSPIKTCDCPFFPFDKELGDWLWFAGKAYIFVKPDTGWLDNLTETAQLTAGGGRGWACFGSSVANNDDTIVVGASSENASSGAAYIFEKPDGGWASTGTYAARLSAQVSRRGRHDDQFGASVAISGNSVAIGAPAASIGKNYKQGVAYLFAKPTTGWSTTEHYTAMLKSLNGTDENGFGLSVSISGDTIVAGAPGADIDGNIHKGAAYIFDNPAQLPTPCPLVTLYGEDSAEVLLLRRYRDEVLQKMFVGKLTIPLYFKLAPAAERIISRSPYLRQAAKRIIDMALPSIKRSVER